ncbi:MAG: O-antigen ligase family protein [Candidatus Sumerlaeaceae bacterium]
MSSRMVRDVTPLIGKKFFILLVGMLLVVLPNFVVPRVATLNPAIHSKILMLRWILGAMLVAAALASACFSHHRLLLGEVVLLAFVFANLISAVTSSTPGFSLTDSWQIWCLPLVSLGIARLKPTAHQRDGLVYLAVGGGGIAALYGLCVYLGYDVLRDLYPFAYSKGDARNYIHSFLGNPEYFGGYMAPLSVLAFGYALSGWHSLWRRLAWLGLCTFFLLALVLSGTRGALLGALFGFVLILLRVYRVQEPATRRRIMAGIGLLVVVTVAAVAVLSFPNPLNVRRMRLAQRFVAAFDLASDSVRERILFFATASRIVKDHPLLGVGPGCFKLHFYPTVRLLVQEDERAGFKHFAETLQGRVAEHAHNDYLEFLSELGAVGFAAFAGVVAVLISRFRARRSGMIGSEEDLSARYTWFQFTIFFGAIACLLLNALFSFPLHLPVRASLFWILVGLFVSCDGELDSTQGDDFGRQSRTLDAAAENS